ncbi:M20/M25/M40 family metallo-hydrolase [Embleya sp. NBC_00896]|uniref:M20/M25/M40 family metallo-hydrolase n=1 Tax=Embleya sp. NBC_00896 TaxID=2975961 RepID=UPI00386E8B96|nr:M20/M25/M40 family metallo-hydrolase [Embleya sp. NBC_00896]
MPAPSEVPGARDAALYVVKLGSATLAHDRVFDELLALHRRGARLLVVAGGAAGIAEYCARIGREVRTLTSRTGDAIRYCPPEELPHVVAAYTQVTLPRVEEALTRRGLSVLAVPAHSGALVHASVAGPLRVVENGRTRLVRDQRAGTAAGVDIPRLTGLLATFDVVCLSPPVADVDGGTPLNIDADVLAAELARALDAAHLRLVTGTAGLLADPDRPDSTLRDVGRGQGQHWARGRMRHKVRAAEIALDGSCDVAITGPHTLAGAHATRFWRAPAPTPDLELLARAVEMASVSGDERELAEYLAQWCAEHKIDAEIDAVGNLVATRGSGPRRLLLLGHLDTVPHRWPARWDGDALTGRGCVDAKASLVTYLRTLADLDVPDDAQVRVVGVVQEETTGAGAFHARDHYPADAVVIGEPSGAGALTIGYYGLVKIRLSGSERTEHTAGKGVRTAGDRMVDALCAVRDEVERRHPDAMTAVLGIHARNQGDTQVGDAVVDVRVPPALDVDELLGALRELTMDPIRLEVVRATPGVTTPRSDPLVKVFQRAFRAADVTPRFLLKKGSSDMNTLATTWHGVPMVAYGPGDAKLDHTPHERLDAAEFRRAQGILTAAVRAWCAS